MTLCTGPNEGAHMLQSGMSSQRTETSDRFTRRQELLETSSDRTSPAQGHGSAVGGTNSTEGKDRQGATSETDLADLWPISLHLVSGLLSQPGEALAQREFPQQELVAKIKTESLVKIQRVSTQ
jgi:hypothetical protein